LVYSDFTGALYPQHSAAFVVVYPDGPAALLELHHCYVYLCHKIVRSNQSLQETPVERLAEIGARLPVFGFFFFIRFWNCGQPVGQLGRWAL
jgi:hypothetical protein